MRLEHTFRVPVPVDEAFKVLQDIERIAPCMPGATLGEVSESQFTGTVKVKVGPISMQFQGTGTFADVDENEHVATIEASGRESRGAGTAKATVRAELHERGERETEVNVVTDLTVTGRITQFSRGVMSDVGAKLLNQFADCLSEELGRQPEPAPEPVQDAPLEIGETVEEHAPVAQASATARTWPAEDAIDLLDVARAPVLKRVLPMVCAAVAVAVVIRLIKRQRAAAPAGAGS